MASTNSHYPNDVDWATISQWIAAGEPDLNPDGAWNTPTDSTNESDPT